MRTRPIESEAIDGTAQNSAHENHFFVWGHSVAMQSLRRVVEDTAATDIPILLVGESGTGKEVLALEIHRLSSRRTEPFMKLSCRSLAPSSLHSQFQSRVNGKTGSGNTCSGTVLLDDICELASSSQRWLLDVLPGGDALPPSHCLGARVISTARRALEEDLRTGKFPEELYFRLNGACLRIPALRQRKEDIPELAEFFLEKYSALFEKPRPNLGPDVLARLAAYSWPGNVRQFENTIKRIAATGDVEVVLTDLIELAAERTPAEPPMAKVSLKAASRAASQQAERELIAQALGRTHWNRKRAAQELQISYKALLYKLKQLGLDDAQIS